jgi:hypothetical protein
MKTVTRFLLTTLLFGSLMFIGCEKEEPIDPPKPKPEPIAVTAELSMITTGSGYGEVTVMYTKLGDINATFEKHILYANSSITISNVDNSEVFRITCIDFGFRLYGPNGEELIKYSGDYFLRKDGIIIDYKQGVYYYEYNGVLK